MDFQEENKVNFLITNDIQNFSKRISKETSENTFYLINLDEIKLKLQNLEEKFRKKFSNVEIAYSYKTNNLKFITKIIKENNNCAEVVSTAELEMAFEDGFKGKKIYFDGPIKTYTGLKKALQNQVNIQVDSINELETIINISKELNIIPKLAFRISVKYKNEKSRFGLNENDFIDGIILLKNNNFTLQGIHFHSGSNINDINQYIAIFKSVLPLIKQSIKQSIKDSKFIIDIGGGFPAHSISNIEFPINIDIFIKKIYSFFKEENINLNKIKLVIEPGRYLVEDNGYLVTNVKIIKKINNKKIIFVSAGTNLVRSIRNWFHPIKIISNSQLKENDIYDIYGSNCFEKDLFVENFPTNNKININDLVIIGSAGGYDIPSANIWTQESPSIYGILNKEIILLRKSQEIREMRNNHLS